MQSEHNHGSGLGLAAEQRLFGRYVLKFLAGRGGMGVVWCAWDERLQHQVALKFLPEIILDDPVALEDLRRETKRCLHLTHPNIVRIYDFEQNKETGAIAMEFVKGQALNLLKGQQRNLHFEVAQLRPLTGQLCDTLSYAHTDAEIVHRDIKPANLMLTEKNQLKIADFGIARNITDSVSRLSIRANDSSGTPGYMSPQQAMGDGPAIADDIYSVGATLYDLLTSRPPFYTGDIPLQILNKVPPSIADRRVELGFIGGQPVPAEWEEVISACLEKSPRARPASIAEINERLGKAPVIDELDSIALTQSPIINRGGPVPDSAPAPLPTRASTRHVSLPPQKPPLPEPVREPKKPVPLDLRPPQKQAAAVAQKKVTATEEDPPSRSKLGLFLLGTVALVAAAAIGIFAAHYLDQNNTASSTPEESVPAPAVLSPVEATVPDAVDEEKTALMAEIAELQKRTGKMQDASLAKDDSLEELRRELAKLQEDFEKASAVAAATTAPDVSTPVIEIEEPAEPIVKAPVAPALTKVAMKVSPAGTRVSVNGEPVSSLSESIELPPGEHTFRLTYGDWQSVEKLVTVEEMESQSIELMLPHGMFRLNSVPKGAALTMDGKSLGKAPQVIPVEPGREYQIAGKYQNWSPQIAKATVTEGDTKSLTLRFPHGTVNLTSEPQGASVTVGSQTMQTPCSMVVEANVNLTAAFTYGEWKPFTRKFKVADQQTTKLFGRIPHGKLSIASHAVGAVIYADGKKLGFVRKGGTEFTLEAGTRKIQVSYHPRYNKANREVTIIDGVTSRLNDISFQGIDFTKTLPSAISVWVNGKFAGRTPFFHEVAQPGRIQLRLEKEGYKMGAHQFAIAAGEELKYTAVLEPLAITRRALPAPAPVPERKPQPNAEPERERQVAPVVAPPVSPQPTQETPTEPAIAKSPQPGSHFTNSAGMQMRWIPLGGFWAAAHEVTRAQYRALMENDPSSFTSSAQLPVQNISYDQAVSYCYKLFAKDKAAGLIPDGYTYHLPSLSQWRTMLGRHGGNLGIDSFVVWKRSQASGPAVVGSLKSPNQYGLHDVRGNMMEWCRDRSSRGYRLLNGGSWSTQVRSATKDYAQKTATYSENNTGFRVVLLKAVR